MSHTPGPWHFVEIDGTRPYIVITPDFHGKPAGCSVPLGQRGLDFLPSRTGSHRGQTMKYRPFTDTERANARLIASAPALLEACIAFCDTLAFTPSSIPGAIEADLNAAYEKARAAIRLAREGQ